MSDVDTLARQIRTELAEAAPEGFHFTDHVLRQDDSLERMASQLRAESPDALSQALSQALLSERNGWAALKLLELMELLALPGCAPALIAFCQNPPDEADRRKFLAGRACEVLLRLPVDRATRLTADAACKIPLQDIVVFRHGADRERKIHRPRKIEWGLLIALMALALLGLWVAFRLPTS
jgi:hypothetical protein